MLTLNVAVHWAGAWRLCVQIIPLNNFQFSILAAGFSFLSLTSIQSRRNSGAVCGGRTAHPQKVEEDFHNENTNGSRKRSESVMVWSDAKTLETLWRQRPLRCVGSARYGTGTHPWRFSGLTVKAFQCMSWPGEHVTPARKMKFIMEK